MVMGLVDVMFVFEIPKITFVLSAAVIMAFSRRAPGSDRPDLHGTEWKKQNRPLTLLALTGGVVED